jgi:hypothetical protein
MCLLISEPSHFFEQIPQIAERDAYKDFVPRVDFFALTARRVR